MHRRHGRREHLARQSGPRILCHSRPGQSGGESYGGRGGEEGPPQQHRGGNSALCAIECHEGADHEQRGWGELTWLPGGSLFSSVRVLSILQYELSQVPVLFALGQLRSEKCSSGGFASGIQTTASQTLLE